MISIAPITNLSEIEGSFKLRGRP